MIVVRVELWPASGAKPSPLACVVITNDGTGTASRGSYDARVLRKGSSDLSKPIRTGRVENYPRASYHVLRLVLRALRACFPEEP
jgi:hypothetical protein